MKATRTVGIGGVVWTGLGLEESSEALTVASDSYRPVPADRAKEGPAEVTACMWCAFECSGYAYLGSYPSRCCTQPLISPNSMTECRDLNEDGECPGYRPSALTRILRKVGLRKPVMR